MKSTHDGAVDQPIQDFSDCHVGIVNVLDDLTTLARQRHSATQRRELAGHILRYFKDVVKVHHTEEEAELFSAVLADATPGDERANVEALVSRLEGEHRRLEGLYADLTPTLSAIAGGGNDALDAAAVASLVTDYRAHARFEEEVLLPLARTILQRNSDHMAALGLALHIRHASDDVRRRFGFI